MFPLLVCDKNRQEVRMSNYWFSQQTTLPSVPKKKRPPPPPLKPKTKSLPEIKGLQQTGRYCVCNVSDICIEIAT